MSQCVIIINKKTHDSIALISYNSRCLLLDQKILRGEMHDKI